MDLPITVRKMDLELPTQDEFDPLWAMNDPAVSYFTLGLSLYLPYLEPYIIKALRRGAADVHDDAIMEKLDKFCRQEAQHYKQHERFNELIHARDYPGLEAIENRVKQDFERFLDEKPLKFNVGFVEGFESYTTQGAAASLNSGAFNRKDVNQKFADLFRWHLTEEIEHRTVAFDVWEHLYGDYAYRVKMCWTAQWHVFRFLWETASHMSRVDTVRYGDRYRIPPLKKVGFFLVAFAQFLVTYMPNYSPRKLKISPAIKELAERYTAQAVG
ncbi:MAG: metal-dependent hydrolase [Gammaproteobacteria bacterium]|nr:metal-dependent hydrolase [Gammaproteobacteria bacterium]